ncbi:hypothetical protein FA95DRAFT_410544 [Auriscalpium vulgare]|uniref:Uncharacterized protein n=1 Tax=Auriscalpium vulgare TaxID=40419 RepID=A0ACB8RGS0_9AGAM|nr:hypothetical protein FA95DRAFT_410544 [Auriscalpium vulgare]
MSGADFRHECRSPPAHTASWMPHQRRVRGGRERAVFRARALPNKSQRVVVGFQRRTSRWDNQISGWPKEYTKRRPRTRHLLNTLRVRAPDELLHFSALLKGYYEHSTSDKDERRHENTQQRTGLQLTIVEHALRKSLAARHSAQFTVRAKRFRDLTVYMGVPRRRSHLSTPCYNTQQGANAAD